MSLSNQPDLSVVAHVDNALERGSFTGNLVAQSVEGDERPTTTCISLKGLKTSALTSRSDRDADEEEMPLITQLEWMPPATSQIWAAVSVGRHRA